MDFLARKKASGPAGTPDAESLHAVYLTPDFAFALLCAARPEGVTEVDHEAMTVEFEHPELFDPNRVVYIYTVDLSSVPAEIVTTVDELQVAVLGQVKPVSCEEFRSDKIFEYFHIKNT